MVRQVRCECGIVVRAKNDDEVIALVLTHVAANHPDLAKTHTADYIRNWIELVPE
jgi:predicted small metal-binding protein